MGALPEDEEEAIATEGVEGAEGEATEDEEPKEE